MSFIFGVVIGAFIGWAVPQPAWAKVVVEKIKAVVSSWVKS